MKYIMLINGRSLNEISETLRGFLSKELGYNVEYTEPLRPMKGGYEAYLYRFRVDARDNRLNKPLVLRLFPSFYGSGRASWDSTIQNVVAESGYPAPKVYFYTSDKSLLGGSFMVMELIEGESLDPLNPKAPEILGKTQAQLHSIDPRPLIEILRSKGIEDKRYRLAGQLSYLNERVNPGGLTWLSSAIQWLKSRAPPEPEDPSIIHGDFHPMNILVKGGEVTGVLDWPNFQVGEPAMDVGFTLLLVKANADVVIGSVQVVSFIEKYLESYRNQRDLDARNLQYYIALRAVRALQEGADGQKVWTQPRIVQNLLSIIDEITKVNVKYPD